MISFWHYFCLFFHPLLSSHSPLLLLRAPWTPLFPTPGRQHRGCFSIFISPPLYFFPLSAVYVFLLLVPFLNHFAVLVFAEPLSSKLSLLLTIQHPLGWLSLGCVGSDWEWISSSVLRRELTIYLLSDDSSLSTSSSSDHLPNKTIYIPQICEQAEW